MARNSRIILAQNIKLDKNYNNVTTLSESAMVSLISNNKITEANDYSFIRQSKNTISTNFSYYDCIRANYIAFQNPDYNNKWFFAFVDEVIYVNDACTQIVYTIDVWATWWDYWQADYCFVIREHVADDTVGLHTLLEGLETGEYVCNSKIKMESVGDTPDDLCYVLASTTSWHTKIDPFADAEKQEPNGGGRYNGIMSGAKYYRMDTINDVKQALVEMSEAGQVENVVGIFIAPKFLCPLDESSSDRAIRESLLPFTIGQAVGDMPQLDGYMPHNNKLLCYPYSYLYASNGAGGNAIYRYEDFSHRGTLDFQMDMLLCPSCSTRISPRDYKNVDINYEYGFAGAKYPIASFQTDMYTNWIVTQSVEIGGVRITNDQLNIGVALGSGLANLAGSVATGNVVGMTLGTVQSGVSVINSVQQMQQHELIAPQTTSQTSTSDVSMALGIAIPTFYKMSIKSEYAQIIDQYFDRYGYKVNKTKIPNLQGRPHWSYVQIASGESIGYGSTPAVYMQEINSICQKGVTIWKNHDEIGNYTLDNTI